MIASWKESYDKYRQCIKKQRHHFADKGPYSQGYGLSSSHMWMWELDHKDGWAVKNCCLQIVVLEKTPESTLDSKEIKPVNPKGNQPWTLTGRNDAEAEAPVHWPPDVKNQLIRKDPDAGKDWRQKEKRATDDGMVGWHHRLKGYDLEQTLRDGEGHGGLECCSPWGRKEWDMAWWLNSNNPQTNALIYAGDPPSL